MLKWILWALLLLLVLLLFCKVRVELLYLDGALTVRVRILHLLRFLVYPVKPKKPRAKKAEKKPKKPKKEKPPKEETPKKKGSMLLGDIVQTLNDLLPLLGRSIDYWLRHLTINRCRVRAVVHREDAAETGLECGKLNAICYTLYAWCRSRIRIKTFSLNIVPNFVNDEEPLNVELHISTSPAALLWGMLLFLARGGRAILKGPMGAGILKKQPKAAQHKKRKKTDNNHKKDGV